MISVLFLVAPLHYIKLLDIFRQASSDAQLQRVPECSRPVRSRRHGLAPTVPGLWLVQSFWPSFRMVPEFWGRGCGIDGSFVAEHATEISLHNLEFLP